MKLFYPIIIFVFMLASCKSSDNTSDKKTDDKEVKTEAVADQIEIKGTALDRKGGAVVATESEHYWIEGKDYWEDEFLNKEVIVTGQLQTRNDNPVFLDTSDIKMQGIPVSSKEELEAQQGRKWIINASVKLAE